MNLYNLGYLLFNFYYEDNTWQYKYFKLKTVFDLTL